MPTPLQFDDFQRAVPAIGDPIRERLTAAGIAILGSVRADGSPRVSPIEVTFFERGLYVGCMPGSLKQLDLDRDRRCCLLTPVADKHDLTGEGKLFAVARRCDADQAQRLLTAAIAAMDHDVPIDDFAGSPVFEVQVLAAAWQYVEGDDWVTHSWEPQRGLRRRRRVGPSGQVVDVDGGVEPGGRAGGSDLPDRPHQ